MEDWVLRALARWPNVPALFGWLSLDRRGRWRIKGEPISRPQILETIGANYAADDYGRWYFQNGPQRGYVQLEYTPWILFGDAAGLLHTHTGAAVQTVSSLWLDDEGSLLMHTEHGLGLLADSELDWAWARLHTDGHDATEEALSAALAQPAGTSTALRFHCAATSAALRVQRCTATKLEAQFGYVADPQPRPGELWAR